MDVASAAQSALEKVRIDPVGFACLAIGALAVGYKYSDEHCEQLTNAASLAGLGILATGIIHTDNLFTYARNIEQSLRSVGFDATRQLRVRSYCYRRASRIICQKTGNAEKFEHLCTITDNQRFAYLDRLTNF